MKKRVLTIFLVVVMFATIVPLSTICSVASTTKKPINICEENGVEIPTQALTGLLQEEYGSWDEFVYPNIYTDYGKYTVIISATRDAQFIAYSLNGVDFKSIDLETDIAIVEDYNTDLWYGSLNLNDDFLNYCNEYYFFELELYDEVTGWETQYIKTKDFVNWEFATEREANDIVLPDDSWEYIGEYNDTHIALSEGCLNYDTTLNKFTISYYISNNGFDWIKKETIKIKGHSEYIEYASANVIITAYGVLFYVEIDDRSTNLTDYIITDNFESYKKLDLSVFDDNENYNLTVEVNKGDKKLVFYRHFDNNIEIYFLNKDTFALYNENIINDVLDYDEPMFVLENTYWLLNENISGGSTITRKIGDDVTIIDSSALTETSDIDLAYWWFADDDNPNADGSYNITNIIGVKNYTELFYSNDCFENVYIFNLPDVYENQEYGYTYWNVIGFSKDFASVYITETQVLEGGWTTVYSIKLSDIEKHIPNTKYSNKWVKDDNGWRYYNADGTLATNKWLKDSVGWCYVGADGYCVTNTWKKDSKGWCYLDANGRMATNKWIKDSQGWCYVDGSGYCVTNTWKKDSKGWVYLDNNGRMVTNKWVKDSKGWCYVGADGYAVTNCWKKDSKGWCYLDENGSMTKNEWVKDGGKWYYLDGNGYMVTGTKKIGGKTYKFNSSGVWVS